MNKSKYAPRPRKGGITQAIWDELATLGGATFGELVKYMPAALMTERRVTRKMLKTALSNGQRRGYFVHNPETDQWFLAPVRYWNEREQFRYKQPKAAAAKKRGAVTQPGQAAPPAGASSEWLAIIVGVSLFWLSIIAAFALGYFAG